MKQNIYEKIFISTLIIAVCATTTLWPLSQAFALGGGGPVPTEEELNSELYGDTSQSSTYGKTSADAEEEDPNENPYSFNVSNITEAIPAVIGCTGVVNKVQKTMQGILDGDIEDIQDFLDSFSNDPLAEIATDEAASAAQEATSVPTSNAALEKTAANTKGNTGSIKQTEKEAKFREECINGVAYSLAKAQLAAMTQKTVNWINSGFGGDPLFLKSPDSFYESLGKSTVRTFLGPIADYSVKDIYPYGRDFARSTIANNRATIQDKLQSTLRNSLVDGATEEDFANDFSKGGWNGWFALTQTPQNNPLGFNIIATQELADKKSKEAAQQRDELAQNNGFLSQKRCVEYDKPVQNAGYYNQNGATTKGDLSVISKDDKFVISTKVINETDFTVSAEYTAPSAGNITAEIQQNSTKKDSKVVSTINAKGKTLFNISFSGLTAGTPYSLYVNFNTSSSAPIFKAFIQTKQSSSGNTNTTQTTEDTKNRNCLKWETVTPGTVIQDQLKTNLGSSTRQLELADSVNESLTAVFSALMNQLINQGLNSLSNFDTKNINSPFGGPGSNKLYDSFGNEITGIPGSNGPLGNVLTVNRGRGWFSVDKFDITTALGDTYGKIESVRTGEPCDPPNKKFSNNRCRYVVKKGVITIQKDYIDAVNKSLKILPNIVPALGELDYCIPGPNPRWEAGARIKTNLLINYTLAIKMDKNNNVITPDFKSFALRQLKGTPGYDALLANSDKWYIKLWDGYEHVLDQIPIIGGLRKAVVGIYGAIYDTVSSIFGGKTRAEAIAADKAAAEKAEADARLAFENGIKNQALQYKINFREYKKKINELYGPESPMRDPFSQWYLPMAEAGLDATRNIIVYDANIKVANADYAEELRKTKANIYKLGIIKEKVDVIVAAARKRLQNEILYKQLHGGYVDLSCFENILDIGQNTGVAQLTTGGSSTGIVQTTAGGTGVVQGNTTSAGAGNNTGIGQATAGGTAQLALTADFGVITEVYKDKCSVEFTFNDKSAGGTSPYTYLWSFETPSGIKSSSNKSSAFKAISSSTDYGDTKVSLKVTDKNGNTDTADQTVTVSQQTKTSSGAACPK